MTTDTHANHISEALAERGGIQKKDDRGDYWELPLSDGSGLILTFGEEPSHAFGPLSSFDWYVAHVQNLNGGEEIGGGTCTFPLALEWIDDYIREPGWDRADPPTWLGRVGRALYGSRWATPMSAAIHVSARNLRRMDQEHKPKNIPPGLARDVLALVEKRRDELARLLTEVPS